MNVLAMIHTVWNTHSNRVMAAGTTIQGRSPRGRRASTTTSNNFGVCADRVRNRNFTAESTRAPARAYSRACSCSRGSAPLWPARARLCSLQSSDSSNTKFSLWSARARLCPLQISNSSTTRIWVAASAAGTTDGTLHWRKYSGHKRRPCAGRSTRHHRRHPTAHEAACRGLAGMELSRNAGSICTAFATGRRCHDG
jgi:hypothetical protein